MRLWSVGELKQRFTAVLEEVRAGHPVGIRYGRRKRLVAVIVPYEQYRSGERRRLGVLSGRGRVVFSEDFAISDEELLGS